ncbi:protein hypothetical protein [Limosa lapponica baueri]|uniref:TAFH domain-containing protein n=1 Tax=Limosa lapponica baueri TaxID=1758121 RepID=A0A2I0TS91_LIMLA|nr:protein hypothetical protein [Limosa lapponica baueri]
MNGSSHSPTAINGAPSTPNGFSNGPATSSTASLSTHQLPPACGARQLSKLKRFLTTLQQFGNDISPEIGERVRTLVLGLVVRLPGGLKRGGDRPLFLGTSEIWWQDTPSLAAVEASWDVAEMAALRKAADDDSDLSHLEGDSAEELAVPDPGSGKDAALVFSLLEKDWTDLVMLMGLK